MNRIKFVIIILFWAAALKGLSQDLPVNGGSTDNIFDNDPINNNNTAGIMDATLPVVLADPFGSNPFDQSYTPPAGNDYTTFDEDGGPGDPGDPVDNVPVDGGVAILLTIGIGLGIRNYRKIALNRDFSFHELQFRTLFKQFAVKLKFYCLKPAGMIN